MKFTNIKSPLDEIITETDELKGIISIWGDIGVGKTTLCLGASLNKLKEEKKVIYISTSQKFESKRLQQLSTPYRAINFNKFLLYNPKSILQLAKIIMNLEFLILEEIRAFAKNSVGLVVLDTATSLFHTSTKGSYDLLIERQTPQLNIFLAELDKLCEKYEIPIIITNRSVSRNLDSEKAIEIQPASPKTIDFWSKTSIRLERLHSPTYRAVMFDKHPRKKLRKIRIQLTETGIA